MMFSVDKFKWAYISFQSRKPYVCSWVTSAKKGIGGLCRALQKWAPREVFCKSITSIVLPAFFYAVEMWYPPNQVDQIRLERVLKYAARLVENDFSPDSTYEQLLSLMKWNPLYRTVAERSLLLIKKYLDGHRLMPDFVFPFAKESKNRCSQRIKSQQSCHSLCLEVRNSQKNSLEEKLAAARMRRLWNGLDEVAVRLRMSEFREDVMAEEQFSVLCTKGAINRHDSV